MKLLISSMLVLSFVLLQGCIATSIVSGTVGAATDVVTTAADIVL